MLCDEEESTVRLGNSRPRGRVQEPRGVEAGAKARRETSAPLGGKGEAMNRYRWMKPWSLGCMLALLSAAALSADTQSAPPQPTPVLQVGHNGPIHTLAYSPDGKTLATGGEDYFGSGSSVRLWDAVSGQVKAVLPPGDSAV